jgi:hypothetical protein
MYLIDKGNNRISKLKKMTFSELKFRERDHLQEWIANNPGSLGEELLIIQKEFSGFSETKERLDLLALDKEGNLVIIENKLDDTGRDVTWQIIKYASYCAGLTKQDILSIYQEYLGTSGNAEERISEFYDNKDFSEVILNQGLNSQRLILVAANFRKEVTSSVLWLLNFKIRIQCFKVTPYACGEQLFLNFEQILPTKDTEEYTISIATKAQEEMEAKDIGRSSSLIRLRFWEQFIHASNRMNSLFANLSPSKDNWIAKSLGMSGIEISCTITGKYCLVWVYINVGTKEENKEVFDFFYSMKDKIESDFGDQLEWDRKDEFVTSRIRKQLDGVSYYEESDWQRMNEFLINTATRLEKVFREPIKRLNNYLKNK